MTIPQWTLIGFALWTILTLLSTVGVTRWRLILSGKIQPKEFRADELQGSSRYRRSMRAHLNCVENLPVYGAIIFGLSLLGIRSHTLDVLAIIFIAARIGQTITHVTLNDTNRMVSIRFCYFLVQILIMLWMIILMIQYQFLGH